MSRPVRTDVVEALIGRDVKMGVTPDEMMGEVIGWYLGDDSWWDLIKMWMKDTGWEPER